MSLACCHQPAERHLQLQFLLHPTLPWPPDTHESRVDSVALVMHQMHLLDGSYNLPDYQWVDSLVTVCIL